MFDYLINGTNSFNYRYYVDEDEAMWEDEVSEITEFAHRQWIEQQTEEDYN